MQIQEGKRYRLRNGMETSLMIPYIHRDGFYKFEAKVSTSFIAFLSFDGQFLPHEENAFDVVEEIDD